MYVCGMCVSQITSGGLGHRSQFSPAGIELKGQV